MEPVVAAQPDAGLGAAVASLSQVLGRTTRYRCVELKYELDMIPTSNWFMFAGSILMHLSSLVVAKSLSWSGQLNSSDEARWNRQGKTSRILIFVRFLLYSAVSKAGLCQLGQCRDLLFRNFLKHIWFGIFVLSFFFF